MIKRFVTCFVFLLGASVAYGQADFTVEGTVTEARSGDPLPGVNVVVQGTSIGTSADAQGGYSLEVPSEDATLVFSFVGYNTKEIPVRGRSEINVSLQVASLKADELVVIGYGTQQREDLTGSVSSIDAEAIELDGPTYSVDQALQGRVAGLQAVFSGGTPGSGADISIRGASSINAGNDPLFVVDGLPSNAPPDPADIQSIEVLKDASATAIYGARAANGVILITTKSGEAGDLEVSYTGEAGMQEVSNKLDLLTPQEYKRVLNGIIDDGGGDPELQVGDIPNGGTNWQDQILQRAPVQNHDISFSGGNDQTQFYTSIGIFDQQGIVRSSSFERYRARINIEHQIEEEFNLGVRLNAHQRNDRGVRNNFGVNENAGALYASYNFDPTLPIKNESGDYVTSPSITTDNPVAIAEGERRTSSSYRTYGTAFAEYFIVPSLSAKVRVGADLLTTRNNTYITQLTKIGQATNGQALVTNSRQRDYLAEGTINYDRTFGNHDLEGVAGLTLQQSSFDNVNTGGEDFPTDVTGTDNLGLSNPELDDNNSFRGSSQLLSTIGRINYTFQDRYLLTATMRIDGSSRFGENNRYGYFPSAAVAWRPHQEAFMEDVEDVSTLKLRASWGEAGNQQIGNYPSLATFGPGPSVVFDDQQVTTTNPSRFPNPNLKWETTTQIDIGLEIGLFDDRLYGTVDYYQKDTEDMLLQLPVPTSTGFSTRLSNIGSIKNTGLEVSLESQNLTGALTWNTNANFSTMSNEVESLGPVEEIITGGAGFTNQISIIRPGLPLRTYYGYEVEGVWQEGDNFAGTKDNVSPGDLKFRDVNGDSTVTEADRVPLGDSFPDFSWSLGNTFNYKGVGLHVFVRGEHGVQMLNNNLVDTYFPINFRRNKFAEPYLNRWTPENPSNKYPSFVTPLSQGNKAVNSRTVQDASYIRLQTVRLSYNVPVQLIGASFLRSFQVYATGENLYTITSYDGVDPAVNPNNNANFRIDYNVYPSTTTYTLGVQMGF